MPNLRYFSMNCLRLRIKMYITLEFIKSKAAPIGEIVLGMKCCFLELSSLSWWGCTGSSKAWVKAESMQEKNSAVQSYFAGLTHRFLMTIIDV